MIRKNLDGNIKLFTNTNIGRRLHAMAVVHAPKIGLDTLAKIICLTSDGTLYNFGVSSSILPALSHMSPSSATLNELVIKLGVDIAVLISKDTQEKSCHLYMMKDMASTYLHHL